MLLVTIPTLYYPFAPFFVGVRFPDKGPTPHKWFLGYPGKTFKDIAPKPITCAEFRHLQEDDELQATCAHSRLSIVRWYY